MHLIQRDQLKITQASGNEKMERVELAKRAQVGGRCRWEAPPSLPSLLTSFSLMVPIEAYKLVESSGSLCHQPIDVWAPNHTTTGRIGFVWFKVWEARTLIGLVEYTTQDGRREKRKDIEQRSLYRLKGYISYLIRDKLLLKHTWSETRLSGT